MRKIDNTDCFARFEMPNGIIKCSALINLDCKNCKFYRNDIKRKDIEKDIKNHLSTRNIRNEY